MHVSAHIKKKKSKAEQFTKRYKAIPLEKAQLVYKWRPRKLSGRPEAAIFPLVFLFCPIVSLSLSLFSPLFYFCLSLASCLSNSNVHYYVSFRSTAAPEHWGCYPALAFCKEWNSLPRSCSAAAWRGLPGVNKLSPPTTHTF